MPLMTNQQAAAKTYYQVTYHYAGGSDLVSKQLHNTAEEAKGEAAKYIVADDGTIRSGVTFTIKPQG